MNVKKINMKALLATLAAITLIGCDEGDPDKSKPSATDVSPVTRVARAPSMYGVYATNVRGHEYLLYYDIHGSSIIHSESCECKSRKARP